MESYALVSKTLGHASHSAHCKHLSASTNPVMFTHQTPEPRYLLDPQGVSPHLRGQTIPRQQPLQTQDPAPHTPSPNSSAQPLRQQPRSRGGGTETVNRNAEATARLLRVSMPPLFAAPELRYRLRLSLTLDLTRKHRCSEISPPSEETPSAGRVLFFPVNGIPDEPLDVIPSV